MLVSGIHRLSPLSCPSVGDKNGQLCLSHSSKCRKDSVCATGKHSALQSMLVFSPSVQGMASVYTSQEAHFSNHSLQPPPHPPPISSFSDLGNYKVSSVQGVKGVIQWPQTNSGTGFEVQAGLVRAEAPPAWLLSVFSDTCNRQGNCMAGYNHCSAQW